MLKLNISATPTSISPLSIQIQLLLKLNYPDKEKKEIFKKIQIQLLLKLNCRALAIANKNLLNSNTTLVKVKF